MSAGFRRIGASVQLGTQLSAAFVKAGLPFPQMRLGSLIGTGPDWAGYDLLAETLCIILPRLVEYGIVQAGGGGIGMGGERLRAEGRQPGVVLGSRKRDGGWTPGRHI